MVETNGSGLDERKIIMSPPDSCQNNGRELGTLLHLQQGWM